MGAWETVRHTVWRAAPLEAWVLFGATTVVGVASYLHRTGWRKVQAASGYSDISLTTLAVHVQPATMSAVAETGQHNNTASLNSSDRDNNPEDDQGETPPHSPPDSPLLPSRKASKGLLTRPAPGELDEEGGL